MADKKVDSARALVAGGWRISLVSRCLRVSRTQLHIMARRSKDWQDRRRKRKPDDTEVLARIHTVIGDLPTYGYCRVWALLRRQSETDNMAVINAKRVYRVMRQNALLPERKPEIPPSKRAHTGKEAVGESNQRWCSDGFEFSCDNGEKLRVMFALDCCDREALHWAASTGGYDSETVQDVIQGAVERRFGSNLPVSPVEWLTDNGSAYRSHQTRQFARMAGLEPKHTAVRSPESNGIAESFVKTMKRDYISIMPKPDGLTAVNNLAEAFEHYSEWHPHSTLGYRSPREYLRRRTSNGLSDKKVYGNIGANPWWQFLFSRERAFMPPQNATEEMSRGAYLVERPEHCGSCHTPRNLFFQEKAITMSGDNSYLSGAVMEGWNAKNLRGDDTGLDLCS